MREYTRITYTNAYRYIYCFAGCVTHALACDTCSSLRTVKIFAVHQKIYPVGTLTAEKKKREGENWKIAKSTGLKFTVHT